MNIVSKRWHGGAIMLLGLWLFLSPWALQYAHQQTAAANAYVLAGIILLFGAIALYTPRVWDEIVNLLLGAWMLLSPFILRFASEHAAAINAVTVGALIMAFASWALFSDAEFDRWWHEHHFF